MGRCNSWMEKSMNSMKVVRRRVVSGILKREVRSAFERDGGLAPSATALDDIAVDSDDDASLGLLCIIASSVFPHSRYCSFSLRMLVDGFMKSHHPASR